MSNISAKSPIGMAGLHVRMPRIPAAFFGIVLGLAGLTNSWRAAAPIWNLPPQIGEAIGIVAGVVWLLLILLYAGKWLIDAKAVAAEAQHPVQCCFIGLIGVSTMLTAIVLQPHSHAGAVVLFAAGAVFTLVFALWRTGILWRGDRDPTATTAVLYLPAVAGSFVMAIALSAFNSPDWGQLAFGAGFFSWLAIESVLLNRLYNAQTLSEPLRPTLGIQLAPPAVGCVAYLSVTTGTPDILAHAMLGYAILQLLLMLRLLPWIRQQPFAASYWAFTFGVTALSTAASKMVTRSDPSGALHLLAPILFVAANVVVGLIAIGTVLLLVRGKLLPKPTPATP
ncbi:tellurite resistance protein TehA [Rhizobium sp. Root708]|uniref:dicarboxylate transporter/tellurite-resistance protein TehA n=1 Tax=Rhizobium sp. Root708 TaxID=1736592 RepID=UPI0006F49DE9|nr:dicarboxylate transporter/tellurite-resistance protein TehA [Rhizobium sp. Root708]KRB61245.1 tellurite resistance protein TehA [Rhizobium sp. Root708]